MEAESGRFLGGRVISESFRLLHTLALCALFLAVSVNRSVYPLLYLTAALALVPLYGLLRPVPPARWNNSLRTALPLFLPLAFILYVAVSPGGRLCTDLPLATVMFAALLCGVGVELASAKDGHADTGMARLAPAMLVLLLSLGGQALWYFLSGQQSFLWDTRLTLLFDHPNALGHVAVWGVLFGMAYLPDSYVRSPRLLLLWVPGLLLGLSIVVLAGSRGVYAGLVLGSLPILLLVYRRVLVPLVLVGVLAGGLVTIILPERHQTRVFSALHDPLNDFTVLSRRPIWDAALDGFFRSPLLGNGLRSFAEHHEAYVRENRAALEARGPVLESRVINPHSLYFGMIYAYGFVGCVLAVLFVGDGVRRALRLGGGTRRAQRLSEIPQPIRKSSRAEDAFHLASILFLLGAGVVDYSLHRKDGILILMLTIGMLCARSLRKQP